MSGALNNKGKDKGKGKEVPIAQSANHSGGPPPGHVATTSGQPSKTIDPRMLMPPPPRQTTLAQSSQAGPSNAALPSSVERPVSIPPTAYTPAILDELETQRQTLKQMEEYQALRSAVQSMRHEQEKLRLQSDHDAQRHQLIEHQVKLLELLQQPQLPEGKAQELEVQLRKVVQQQELLKAVQERESNDQARSMEGQQDRLELRHRKEKVLVTQHHWWSTDDSRQATKEQAQQQQQPQKKKQQQEQEQHRQGRPRQQQQAAKNRSRSRSPTQNPIATPGRDRSPLHGTSEKTPNRSPGPDPNRKTGYAAQKSRREGH
ncbi:hypothetical protein P389DRAFT_210836 [Cystobasidium minutum MCA 4210]|uniref:uncharacterized protein n=1 Tax=Cystobasidium minutum MCA 4210 TaxID=1397322 RepID=UPI0034D01FA6|eukprot:jgi/Rhomi1/210836/estExt_Genemark1.C_4_t10415